MTAFEPGARYVVNADGIPEKQKSRTNKGLVIEGVATKYDTVLYYEAEADAGRFINIQAGAFLIQAPVQLMLDHDPKLAMPGCKVELFSDEQGLNFRAHLDDSELAFHARDLVECGSYSEVSASWHSSKIVTRYIDGKTLYYIVSGVLQELSLVPAGAIKTTHCQVRELKNLGTLEHDSKSLRFRSDNTAASFSRALKRLGEQYE